MLKKIILPNMLIISFVTYSAQEAQSKAAAAQEAAQLAKNILAKEISGAGALGIDKSAAEQIAATEALKKSFTEMLGGATARAQSRNRDLASKIFDNAIHDLQVEKLEKFLTPGVDTLVAEKISTGEFRKIEHAKELLRTLLAKGIDAQDDYGDTLLMHAIREGHPSRDAGFLDAVLALKPNVNKPDGHGQTPLMLAVKDNSITGTDLVKRLIALKADVNAKDKAGNTALIYAIKAGNSPAVKILLGAGADISGEAGTELIELAEMSKHPEILKLLKDAGATWSFDAGGWPEAN
jgi:hypothetical protein